MFFSVFFCLVFVLFGRSFIENIETSIFSHLLRYDIDIFKNIDIDISRSICPLLPPWIRDISWTHIGPYYCHSSSKKYSGKDHKKIIDNSMSDLVSIWFNWCPKLIFLVYECEYKWGLSQYWDGCVHERKLTINA